MLLLIERMQEVKVNFVVRWTEWFMAVPAILMAIAFLIQPNMFDLVPTFIVLERWADEPIWRNLFFLAALCRFVALVTHSRSDFYRWCPFLRVSGAFIGFYIWGESASSFVVSSWNYDTTLWPAVTSLSLTIIEARNLYVAGGDSAVRLKSLIGGE